MKERKTEVNIRGRLEYRYSIKMCCRKAQKPLIITNISNTIITELINGNWLFNNLARQLKRRVFRQMKLLTKKLIEAIPKLYQTEDIPLSEKVAYAKLFHPVSSWSWYIIEYDGIDTCFGLVAGHDIEFGYFSLRELEQIQVLGLPIERDLYFRSTQMRDLPIYNIEQVVA